MSGKVRILQSQLKCFYSQESFSVYLCWKSSDFLFTSRPWLFLFVAFAFAVLFCYVMLCYALFSSFSILFCSALFWFVLFCSVLIFFFFFFSSIVLCCFYCIVPHHTISYSIFVLFFSAFNLILHPLFKFI